MRIVLASSEVAPFAKTGGLGDVTSALGRYLGEAGHDVRLFLPLYGALREGRDTLVAVDFLQGVAVHLGGREYTISVYTAPIPGSSQWAYFISCPPLYARKSIYGMDGDEYLRFGLLSVAALVCCQRMGFAPDIVHAHDWHTALMPLYLKTHFAWDSLFAGTKTVLTLHNLSFQGVFPSSVLPELGLGDHSGLLEMRDLRAGRFNFLKTGILYADAVTAVSETYAKEIQTEQHGFGLDGLLRARSATVVGIANGVDYEEWSPEKDRFIPHAFSADDLSGKASNKEHLLETLELSKVESAPLIGIVSRLTKQKGFELTYEVLPEVLRGTDVRLVVLGSGDPAITRFFAGLQRSFPGKACFINRYDNEAAHLIEAASDMFLMPSLFEPCGLNQMYSLRYGTIPIVRRTGGLSDTVKLWNPETRQGTGFVFDHFTPAGFAWALRSALTAWHDRDAWATLQQNAMAEDFSWQRQIRRYVALYEG